MIIMFYYLNLNILCHTFLQINCNPNDLLYTVGSLCGVILILITTFGSKHVRNINNCRNIH